MSILIADSGATKCEWCLLSNGKKKTIFTQGMSPYYLKDKELLQIIQQELLPSLKKITLNHIYFYGTGCSSTTNKNLIKHVLQQVFSTAKIMVDHDLMAAARALCGREKGIACILGTGTNSCYYDGKKIVKNVPGLGYVLGDEGSGAYLGKKVLQYYFYKTFDEDLMYRFDKKYHLNDEEVMEHVYKQSSPSRYLASFAMFLDENRDHYMIENIIEDGLNDFFFQHLCKYSESWKYPINFVGSIAYGFKDVLQDLCSSYKFTLGKVLKSPMDGLVEYHKQIAN